MADYNIQAVHDKILGICKALDETCKSHGLTYYLWAGTMIGAVRHQGFIPWDDDMDIAMPRADYDKLIAHCKEWLPQQYEMICSENDANYPLPFAKIQDANTTLIERAHMHYTGGIYLDVFPIDGVPTEWIARHWQFTQYQYWKKVLYLLYRDPYKHGHGVSSWIPLLCRKFYTLKGVQDKIRTLLHKYSYDNNILVADYDDGMKGVMNKNILGHPTAFTFENTTLLGVEHYEAYLSNKYGDYMTLPDEKHQRQHNFHYLDLENSYKDYYKKNKNSL